ncbi:MAG: ATP-grasp domain-containing protein [Butyrivibrio sp.]|uniref:ATP-grasp domain-containing protein n=1 Tax=Butyrivibrio sp. TaxID=28121 RepID=UPI001B0733F3|nr:ATP-grasp domain-containing protein [Butyrivibrio sp.]MBO6241606.1 ATP-grasp domain-containing protein [Butyrivibrio sp.]
MRAAVIGASSESIYTIGKAREMGLEVVALDGDSNAPGLKAADKSFVVDIRDPQKVIEVLDENIPDIVLPVPIGRYLTTTGVINDYYGLCGVTETAAKLCTDKYEFHRILHEKGLRNAELYLIPAGCEYADPDELNNCYPVVVKPRFGSGSRGVQIYNTKEELAADFLSQLPFDEDYCIESCIDGPEYGVDGVFTDGFFRLILLRGKKNTLPPYRECVGYYSIIEDEDNKEFFDKIKDLMQKAGDTLGFKNNLIHADIIKDANGNPFLIETSARPSGHNLHNLFTPMASGVDEVSEFIKYALPDLGRKYVFEPNVKKHMVIRYFDFENVRVNKVPDEKYLLEKYPLKSWKCNIEPGMILGKVMNGASVMGRGFFVIEASSREELDHYCNDIKNEFELEDVF